MRKIIRLFESGNVSVYGLRGRGKDMLMANVAVRRNKPYISNVSYGGVHYPFEPKMFECGGNTYKDLISGKVKKYVYPFSDGVDIYISDAGIYFPAQYCNELNRDYKQWPMFMALSRHLGDCNVHCNSQSLNRVWDKIREQSDIYIRCMWCKVLFHKIVFQRVYIYERYDSAANCVPLFDLKRPLLNPTRRLTYDLAKQSYLISHGKIEARTLIYVNRSNYDTRRFKEVFSNGEEV